MPEFTITRTIEAPLSVVWDVLHDFGDIQRWNPGVKESGLTSDGPVTEGSTRFCELAPFGGVEERVDHHEPHKRLKINIFKTRKLPISNASADFHIEESGDGTELRLHYSYTPNLLGRVLKGFVDKQMRKGIAGLAKSLQTESERMAAGKA